VGHVHRSAAGDWWSTLGVGVSRALSAVCATLFGGQLCSR